MRNLIFLIFRYSAFLVFILFELLSFYLIISYNKSQKEIWANSSNLFSGSIHDRVQKVEDFFTQQQLNDKLLKENARLLETIINYRVFSDNNDFQLYESIESDTIKDYKLIPARVCSKTVNLRNNYFTLCSGTEDGIEKGMGVISRDGVVGIVKNATDHFSTVLLLINSQSRISAMVHGKGYHGNLLWVSSDIRKMKLSDVPKHAEIKTGDTIVTSGYSISFPPHIPIGKVSEFKILGGSNNYDIDIDLDYDLSETDAVYVIKYEEVTEKDSILVLQHE